MGFLIILIGFCNTGQVGYESSTGRVRYGSLNLHYMNMGQNELNESNMG